MERRAQLPSAQQHEGDEARRPRLLLPFEHQGAGIAGIVEVVREAYPDFTARKRGGDYFDPRATDSNPIWEMVDVAFKARLPRYVTLAEMRANPALAATMVLLKKGSRLSVQPVHVREWNIVLK